MIDLDNNLHEHKNTDMIGLVGGTLIDGTGASAMANTTVLIKGEKIEAVGPMEKVTIPNETKVIDISNKMILPGFVDTHIHVTYPEDERQHFTETNSIDTLRALYFMNMYLRSGVTSIRDAGAPIEPMRALSEGAHLGYIDTIRLFSCGQLITVTGGHGGGLRLARIADGPWEFRNAVREMFKAGFRHVKLSPTFTIEEVKAAVEEAKILGMRITSHGGGLSDTTPTSMTRMAVQAGIQCIEHLNEMEDDVLDLIAKKEVYIVPTLAIYREQYKENDIPKALIEKRGWSVSMHETLFKKARARNITMAIGTDAVGSFMKLYPDIYFTEMKYFVELGASPMEAIVAATRNGAMVLGNEDKLGTIEVGKLADIQVLKRDPLRSFDALGNPEIVIVGGRVHQFK